MRAMNGESVSESRAIFGGSFDPVHLGHLRMATAAMEVVSLEEIVFMPCFVSPFKESTMASAGQRHHMLNLAIEDEALNHVSVSDLEIRREGPSYSWQTAKYLIEQEPRVKWHWIIGSDQWDSIEKWANPAFLRDQLHFLVLKRQGQNVQEREGWEFTAVPFNHPASSTEIRADFSSHLEWVTPAVASFCEESGLYGA